MIFNAAGLGLCSHCGQFKTKDQLRMLRGKYESSCRQCENARRRLARAVKNASRGFPTGSNRHWIEYNRSVLSSIAPGIYALESLREGSSQPGFTAVWEDRVLLNIWNRDFHFVADMVGIALFLANRGIRMTDREATLRGEDGHRIRLMDLPRDREPLELRAFLLP